MEIDYDVVAEEAIDYINDYVTPECKYEDDEDSTHSPVEDSLEIVEIYPNTVGGLGRRVESFDIVALWFCECGARNYVDLKEWGD